MAGDMWWIVMHVMAARLATGVLVWHDAKERGLTPWLWALAAVLLPLLAGLAIYLHLRGTTPGLRCSKCGGPVRSGFLVCPHCGTALGYGRGG